MLLSSWRITFPPWLEIKADSKTTIAVVGLIWGVDDCRAMLSCVLASTDCRALSVPVGAGRHTELVSPAVGVESKLVPTDDLVVIAEDGWVLEMMAALESGRVHHVVDCCDVSVKHSLEGCQKQLLGSREPSRLPVVLGVNLAK